MKIALKARYKSITTLEGIDLPDFTVITGVNGSGKTHLLEAIAADQIQIENHPSLEGSIQYYNAQILLAQLEAKPTSNPNKRRVDAVKALIKSISQNATTLTSWAVRNKISGNNLLSDINWLACVDYTEFTNALGTCTHRNGSKFNMQNAMAFAQSFINQRDSAEKNLSTTFRQYGDILPIIKRHASSIGRHVFSLSEEEIRAELPLLWNPSDKLSLRFSEWFSQYHIAWERNRVDRFYAEKCGEQRKWLSEEDFELFYGPKPWELANEVLEQCGTYYRFESPTFFLGTEDEYVLQIQDLKNQELKLDTSDLSTGEKLLLSIIAFLYRASGSRTLTQLPNLLLLDEVDSPLHPGFTKQLISILHDTLVSRCGIKVILVTHSPSTVALAPEKSIYELQKNPRALIHVSRAQAIEVLTSGFISILPSSRVVITESEDDSRVFSAYYQVLTRRYKVKQEPPLTFLPASRKNSHGDGGVYEVKKWAPKLGEFFKEIGFFGLIDRDNSNSDNDVVRVLRRHSIENYLADPLTIIAHLIKEGVTDILPSCPIKNMDFHAVAKLENEEAQAMLDELCVFLEGQLSNETSSETFQADYIGGQSVRLPIWIRDMRGHDLASEMRRIVNSLLVSRRKTVFFDATNPFRRAIEIQTLCLPDLISKDFVEIFSSMQEKRTLE